MKQNKTKQGNGSGLLHDTSCMVHTLLCNRNLYNLLWKPQSRRGYRCSCYDSLNVNEYTCGEYRHLVYIAHKELHNCKLPFLFKGSTNTLESGMPGELLHFCIFFFPFYSKKHKGKTKGWRERQLVRLVDFLLQITKNSIKVSMVYLWKKKHI